jgi:hypothetical protein
MPHAEKVLEPWHSFLAELDDHVAGETQLDCIGGFVVTQFYGFSRQTADLGVLLIAPRDNRSRCSSSGFKEDRASQPRNAQR